MGEQGVCSQRVVTSIPRGVHQTPTGPSQIPRNRTGVTPPEGHAGRTRYCPFTPFSHLQDRVAKGRAGVMVSRDAQQ